MSEQSNGTPHSADAAALGFYFQAFYALLSLLERNSDDASVALEQLDDVEVTVHGQRLLYQLKHSLSSAPKPLTLSSRALWRTMKAWIDALPRVTLAETTFHLVTVAHIPPDCPLLALTDDKASRETLALALAEEAQRVVDARETAPRDKRLPHADRIDGCRAYLGLGGAQRLALLNATRIKPGAPSIQEIESLVACQLLLVPAVQRPLISRRLVEWWDRQVIYSLCAERDRVITRGELQQHISVIIGDVEQERLQPDFETVCQPDTYQPDGMLARQIDAVGGTPSDHSKAIREEWRARAQRSKWLNERPSLASILGDYDLLLEEHWSDRHTQMAENCLGAEEEHKRTLGLQLLRWTHDEAPSIVRPVVDGWHASYYVRGSYQVLAINLRVGWHPEYSVRLGGEE